MRFLSDLGARLASILWRGREERELEEELRFHVDMEAEHQRRRGVAPHAARRRGLIALGGIERTKEDVRDARGTRVFDDTLRDVAFGVRTLARSPAFALVVIVTLALGIGGTTAIFSAVDATLVEPLPYQEPGQLVRLYEGYTGDPSPHNFVSPTMFLAYRERLSSFEQLVAGYTYDDKGADISRDGQPERIHVLQITAGYFAALRRPPAIGREFSSEEEIAAPSVILSHRLWADRFHSDRTALGAELVMDGRPYTVVGVMPNGFVDPLRPGADAYVPMDLTPGRDPGNVDNHYLTVLGRLRPETPIARAQAELDALGIALGKEYPDASHAAARLYSLKRDMVGPASRALELVLGAVGLVLLLVCVNVATLLLVRASARAHEFALRSALGARRTRLLRQILIESLVLALAGDALGLVVARVAMTGIVRLGAGSVPRLSTLTLDPRLLAFSIVITSACAVLFGLTPALRAARTDPIDALRGEDRALAGSRGHNRLRSVLVTAQVGLAFILMVGAGLLLVSFHRIRSLDLGVDTDHTLVFELHLPDTRYDSTARAVFYDAIAAQLAHLPGVRAAGGISKLPATGEYHDWGTRALTGPNAGKKDANVGAQQRVVSGDYFAAAGIRIVEGRAFDARDGIGTPKRAVISSLAAARLFPGADPIGQTLRTGGFDWEVIGVVPDVSTNAEGEQQPIVYHAHAQFAGDRNWALTQIIATTGAPGDLVPLVRRTIAGRDPQLVMYRPMTLAEAIGAGTAQRKFTLVILTSFAGVAMLLAALGLFGALAYAVKLRSREFGVRMAIGADRGAIRRLVLQQGFIVTLSGILLGLVGSAAFARVMSSVVFHVKPLEPSVLGGAAVVILVVGAIAAYLPARRATAVDPRSILQ
ncbi:MAG TPA: ABC transporter permease [Gemmatimonadaceae bacterium]|nr:ABC transporter permease [Gemmatimonadaceae bacterium]